MTAILCSQYCLSDDLVLADIPDPVAGPGEAMIAIKAAPFNFFDILMIQGKYQTHAGLTVLAGSGSRRRGREHLHPRDRISRSAIAWWRCAAIVARAKRLRCRPRQS